MKFAVVASQVVSAWAHGGLVGPKTWWNQYGALPIQGGSQIMSVDWFMNWTFIPNGMAPKLTVASATEDLTNSPRGYGIVSGNYDRPASEGHPWVAPGTAPIDSPCGIKGGNKQGCFAPGTGGNAKGLSNNPAPCGGGGTAEGKDSLTMASFADYFKSPETTYWTAGETAETGWGVIANHGGGYTFRLCPVNSFDPSDLVQVTEACFEANPLEFFGQQQWVQYGNNVAGRVAVTPVLVTGSDVHPSGSQWRKNPIPACKGYAGGSDGRCDQGPWFTPPIDGAFGFGNVNGDTSASSASDYLIVDKVKVPNTPGKFVLGWRYDCEQTPQIWLGCSNIQILGPNEEVPPAATPCICPAGKVLDATAVAKYLPEHNNYPWTCSEADAYFKSPQNTHSCDIIQTYVVAAEYPHCCIDPPPVPEPEGDLGGGTSYGGADESEPEAESEPETETQPEVETTTTPPQDVQARSDGCICDDPAKFTGSTLMPHGYTCQNAVDWLKGGSHDCGIVHTHYGISDTGNPAWSSVCCNQNVLTQVSTKFSHRVSIQAHSKDGRTKLIVDGHKKVKDVSGITLSIPNVKLVQTATVAHDGSVSF